MSKATDILRVRDAHRAAVRRCTAIADLAATIDAIADLAATIDAIADLMDACVDEEPGRFQCRVCRSAGRSDVYLAVRVHTGDCKLAALERAITGDSSEI